MLIRICGIIVVMLACCGLGFRMSYELVYRIEDLQQIKRVMVMLRGEIKYASTPLTEALFSISTKVPSPWREFLQEMTKKMEECGGKTLTAIFQTMMEKHLAKTSLQQKDISQFAEFGANLGYLDKEMQLNSIDLYMEGLDRQIKEAEEKVEKRGRLYRYLGMAVGVLILLIIL